MSAQDEVKRLRRRTGLTQEAFAKFAGVSFVTVNRWENGHATPHPVILQAIRAKVAARRKR